MSSSLWRILTCVTCFGVIFEYRFVFIIIIIIIVLTQNLVVVVDVIGLMRRKPDLTWLFLVHTEKIYENLPTLKDVEGPG